ncbi:hypothetical protein LSH36_62g03004 [Paralvinella palmiformis]|uniref:Uncharacterized protein n=1 Tax=Paralvinella palmiformis TaxID=53620 RepID=A0AAD9K5S4_9ANNE|nr:hypothetical protein LSH36_62g03004 [Paralvinella palmiformis]
MEISIAINGLCLFVITLLEVTQALKCYMCENEESNFMCINENLKECEPGMDTCQTIVAYSDVSEKLSITKTCTKSQACSAQVNATLDTVPCDSSSEIEIMAYSSDPSNYRLPTAVPNRNDSIYYRYQQPLPRAWLSSSQIPSSSTPNGNIENDMTSDDPPTTKKPIHFFSYRAKTTEKYIEYEHLHNLTFRQLYMGLVNNTTAHGLPHIHTAKGCVKKTFWIILTLLLVSAWLWNSHDVLLSFIRYDVTVSYDIRLAHEVGFPAVTICNQNVARWSKLSNDPDGKEILEKSSEDLFGKDAQPGQQQGGGSVPGPSSQGGGGGNSSSPGSSGGSPSGGSSGSSLPSPQVKGGLATERNELAQRKLLIQEFLIGLNPDTRAEYGHQFKPLISSSQYAGYDVYNTTFKDTYDLNYGNCYTFNTGSIGTEDSLFAFNTGPDYGLVIIFATEEHEYIGEITYKQGLRVVVHNPRSPPFPIEQGIDIAPGMSTSIGVRKVTINRLGGLYDVCVNTSLSHSDINVYEQLYNWTSYTIIGCQKTCYQQAVMKSCGCFDPDYPSSGLAFAGSVLSGVCSYGNETQDDCKTGIYDKLRNGKLLCSHCQKPCTEEYFETSLSMAMWPAKKYEPNLIELFEDNPYMTKVLTDGHHEGKIGLFEVYFESLNLEEMTEQPAYASSQFIADIGGTIGLWVGASMMTIFEFGEFFLDALFLFLVKCLRRPDPDEHPSKSCSIRTRNQSRHVYKMTSRSLPSEDGFPGHVHDREDLGYDRHLQQLPKLWSSPNYIASSKPNRNIFIDEDGVISNDPPMTNSGVSFCSYRAKTTDKYTEYKYLHDLSFRSLYMGLVRNTTANGLPHIHTANGCVKKSFWIILTLFLIGVWLWNSHDVLASFLRYDVTVSYDIRLAHEVEFPAVTICNQNVARSSKLNNDPSGKDILDKPPTDLFNRNSKSGKQKGGGGSNQGGGGGGSGPASAGGSTSAGGGSGSSSAGGSSVGGASGPTSGGSSSAGGGSGSTSGGSSSAGDGSGPASAGGSSAGGDSGPTAGGSSSAGGGSGSSSAGGSSVGGASGPTSGGSSSAGGGSGSTSGGSSSAGDGSGPASAGGSSAGGGSGPASAGGSSAGGASGPTAGGGSSSAGGGSGSASGGSSSAGDSSGPASAGGSSAGGASGPTAGGGSSSAGGGSGSASGGSSSNGDSSGPASAGGSSAGGGSGPTSGRIRRDIGGPIPMGYVLGSMTQLQQSEEESPPPVKSSQPGGLATERNEVAQRKILIQEFLTGLDPETRTEYGHQFDPLISSSEYSGYDVSNTTFKATYDLSYGNCYTFNTGSNGTESSLFAFNTGPDYGLAIVFVLEEEEYIGEITFKQGLRVVVHNPKSPPFPAEQGIDVAPGKSTAIGVRKVTINRLGGLYNDCINMSKTNADINVYEELYDWTAYTIIGCQKTCYQQAVIQTCGCFDHYFPESGIAFADNGLVSVCSYANETQDDCKTAIYDQLRNGKLLCSHCQKPCSEEYFETSISASLWPATKYISSQFIADIGGTIGLWVGASMMTIFEFGEFFLDALFLFLVKCLRRPDPDEHRRSPARSVPETYPGLPLRRVYDPDTNWNHASTLNRPASGKFMVHGDDWIINDNQRRLFQGHLQNEFRKRVYE